MVAIIFISQMLIIRLNDKLLLLCGNNRGGKYLLKFEYLILKQRDFDEYIKISDRYDMAGNYLSELNYTLLPMVILFECREA